MTLVLCTLPWLDNAASRRCWNAVHVLPGVDVRLATVTRVGARACGALDSRGGGDGGGGMVPDDNGVVLHAQPMFASESFGYKARLSPKTQLEGLHDTLRRRHGSGEFAAHDNSISSGENSPPQSRK
jgi:hypothetical protein